MKLDATKKNEGEMSWSLNITIYVRALDRKEAEDQAQEAIKKMGYFGGYSYSATPLFEI